MSEEPIQFPLQLRYSCHMCSGCCRHWDVVLGEQEARGFRDFDWAATRDRFRGREIMSELRPGVFHLSHVEDACIFLDDDNLCAIHKELGMDAKPRMCRQFPYHTVDTPDGIVGSLDFSCPSVAANRGTPIDQQLAEYRMVVVEARAAIAERQARGELRASHVGRDSTVQARKGVPLTWADYSAFERGALALLQDEAAPLTRRLVRFDALAHEAARHAAPGAMAVWIDGLRAGGWEALDGAAAGAAVVSALRQRAMLSSIVSSMEHAWGAALDKPLAASDRVSLAFAIVSSQSRVRLTTADAILDLSRMRVTRFAQDEASFNEPLVRYLSAFVSRKSLVVRAPLLDGARYLALYFAAIRWYAVARAVLADRPAVEPEDLRYAIQMAEKILFHAEGFISPKVRGLFAFFFGRMTPSWSLYPSPYPD